MGGRPGERPASDRRDGTELVLAVFAVILMGGVLAFDLLTPGEVTAGALYAMVIFYSSLLRANRLVLAIALLCSALTLLDLFVGRARGRLHRGK